MTIYESLGIDAYLDETIPIDDIINNIDRYEMRRDADVFFKDTPNFLTMKRKCATI